MWYKKDRVTYKLPPLPYSFDALEPYIDARTMKIHHDKHHAAYVEKLNLTLNDYPDLNRKPIEELLKDLRNVPEEVRLAVRNFGGGYYNHSFFWKVMGMEGGKEPGGKLAEEIDKKFGEFSSFKEEFTKAAVALFGSGWVWLVVDKVGELAIVTTPNQDCPISQGQNPILTLDLWEHAYYLNYQNRRPEYVNAWWNIINWREVENLFKP